MVILFYQLQDIHPISNISGIKYISGYYMVMSTRLIQFSTKNYFCWQNFHSIKSNKRLLSKYYLEYHCILIKYIYITQIYEIRTEKFTLRLAKQSWLTILTYMTILDLKIYIFCGQKYYILITQLNYFSNKKF